MKITSVIVSNFRGIRHVAIEELKSLVVIAGQNGSGKSCILDAIRLLKSVYGGYQPNEFHQWFGEFQINFSNDPKSFERLLNDRSLPLHIEVTIALSPEEKKYLRDNALELVTLSVWRAIAPELGSWSNIQAASMATQYRSRQGAVAAQAAVETELLLAQLMQPSVKGSMSMRVGEFPQFENSKLLEIVFSSFSPDQLGLIDYHGPHRLFGREQLQNINVDLNAAKEQQKQSSLYNYNNKYSNVKSEMAALYVREALAKQAGGTFEENQSVTATLQELFQTFFPDKVFLGPQPTREGRLEFPVKVGGRETHDLDELSSGEKEILYGYLRLRNSAPRHSVILLDEPELHLNPALTRRLPDFYNRHLAVSQDNQVWLITHSDAMLRESVGNPDYSVFHMSPSAWRKEGENQAKAISAAKDIDAALVDLVGDLAAYRPDAKVVIFEGAEESEFDVRMTAELFPKFAATVNCISGTNKKRVKGLYEALGRLKSAGAIAARVFAITDADSDAPTGNGADEKSWDVYHIENYLLHTPTLAVVANELAGVRGKYSEVQIEKSLVQCASDTLQSLVIHKLQNMANSACMSALELRVNINSANAAADIVAGLEDSMLRLQKLQAGAMSASDLKAMETKLAEDYSADLASGRWRHSFRGRSILNRMANIYGGGVRYEVFRNLILARMRDAGVEPAGMKAVLDQILAAR